VLRWDGAMWRQQLPFTSTDLNSVWCDSNATYIAVGAAGFAGRWNGTSWVQWPAPTTEDFISVWAAAANNVYALTLHDLFRWNGAVWQLLDPSMDYFSQVWGLNGQNIYAGGTRVHGYPWFTYSIGALYNWNGSVWNYTEPFEYGMNTIHGQATNDLHVAGPRLARCFIRALIN